MTRKIVLLTEGLTNPHNGKTARNLISYKPEEVLCLLDRPLAGMNSAALLGVGNVPVTDTLDAYPDADTLVIGVATPGGKIPAAYREIILQAIHKGMHVINGLHDFLSDDTEITDAARQSGVRLTDIRKNDEHDVVNRKGINEQCLRVHTVGNDCSLGKMIVSLELNNALKAKGYDAKFVATGQTGILIEGDGIPIDSVVADFINGSAEKLVLQNQHHAIINIEGQGSLFHPRYSSVTLGLLHGSIPHGLIMCYEMGREFIHGMDGIKIPPLATVIKTYESTASIMHPCRVIGIAINSRKFSAEEADAERKRVQDEFGLPACDVIRHGADDLVEAVIRLQKERIE